MQFGVATGNWKLTENSMKTEPLTEIRVLFAYYSEPTGDLMLAGELLQGIGTPPPKMKLKLKDGKGIWVVNGFGHVPPEAAMADPPRIALSLQSSIKFQELPVAGQHLIEIQD